SRLPGAPPEMLKIILIAQFIVGGTFIGLYFWARTAPLPASIVGLVIYITLVVLNVISSISQIRENGGRGTGTGIGGIGIGWLDLLIMAFLAQGIQAGVKHRKLLAQQA